MRKARIIFDFLRMPDGQLGEKSTFILTSMTGNSSFPNSSPSLAAVDTAIQNYTAAFIAAKNKDKVKISVKNSMRTALTDILTTLANYVSFTANGDRSMLVSSGYTVSAESKSSTILGSINGFSAVLGAHPGQLVIAMESVDNAKTYVYLCKKASVTEDVWMVRTSSYPTFTFTNLDPLQQYCVRVIVTGAKDQAEFSEIITKNSCVKISTWLHPV